MHTEYAESLREITHTFVETQRENTATIRELVDSTQKSVQTVVDSQQAMQTMMSLIYTKLGVGAPAPQQPNQPAAQPRQGDGTDNQTTQQPDPANQKENQPTDP